MNRLSWLVSHLVKKPLALGLPPAISIELTNHCNLRCPECPSGAGSMTRERGYMDELLFAKIIDELHDYLFYTQLYFQGESLLHPGFIELLSKAQGCGIIISTNGHHVTPAKARAIAGAGVKKVIISYDGTDRETYAKYRVGGDLERVKEGIGLLSREFGRLKKKGALELQMLVNRYNEQQLAEASDYAASVGARFKAKTMQIIDEEGYDRFLPGGNKYSRYSRLDAGWQIKGRAGNGCLRLWTTPVITWDGKVLPCCFDKDADHIMGDIRTDDFSEIWKGEKYRDFRNIALSNRSMIDICRNCTTGLRAAYRYL